MDWDVFISHAWEDKEDIARPPAETLRRKGLRVWYDEFTLTRSGDTVRLEGVTKGLADRPPEDGFCMAEPARDRQEAATAPCVSSTVIEGRRVADL